MVKAKKVPQFKSVKQQAKFWDTHSTEDFPEYWNKAGDVKFPKRFRDNVVH